MQHIFLLFYIEKGQSRFRSLEMPEQELQYSTLPHTRGAHEGVARVGPTVRTVWNTSRDFPVTSYYCLSNLR